MTPLLRPYFMLSHAYTEIIEVSLINLKNRLINNIITLIKITLLMVYMCRKYPIHIGKIYIHITPYELKFYPVFYYTI